MKTKNLLTNCQDTDRIIINFFDDIDQIINYALLSKSTYQIIKDIYKVISFYLKNHKNTKLIDFVDWASEKGYSDVLEWFKNSGFEFKYSVDAIDDAAKNGHINILEWFKKSGFDFKYTSWAIDWASQNGHTNVLEWFKNSGFEFKYTNWAIDWASNNGHSNVLEWFKNSGFELFFE